MAEHTCTYVCIEYVLFLAIFDSELMSLLLYSSLRLFPDIVDCLRYSNDNWLFHFQ